MTISTPRIILIAVLLLVLIGAGTCSYAIYRDAERHATSAFFRAALYAHEIDETVLVGGTPFRVSRGVIIDNGTPLDPEEEYKVLSLAYEVSLARRSPLLSLEGTDPDRLAKAVTSLSIAADHLADAQISRRERAAVRPLFPLTFLRSLAELERARQVFVATGSDRAQRIYAARLDASLEARSHDLRSFSKQFRSIELTDYAVIAGVVTTENASRALVALEEGQDALEAAHAARTRCLGAHVADCDTDDLRLVRSGLEVLEEDMVDPSIVNEVIDIRSTTRDERFERGYLVKLEKSSCMGDIDAPLYFSLQNVPGSEHLPALEFVGDIFFTSIGGADTRGLFENLGVSHLLYTPTSYYTCPESARDLARASAVRYVGELKEWPGTTNIIREQDAIRFIDEGLASTGQRTKQRDSLLKGYLRMRDNSAAFDALVREIAVFAERDLEAADAGLPVSIEPAFFVPVRSAYFVLFLGHNPSSRTPPVDLVQAVEQNPLLSELQRWSTLRDTVRKEDIARDIDTYFTFHITPADVVHALDISPRAE